MRGVVGVQSVTNNLKVDGPEREDSQVQADVALDLPADAMPHDFDLQAKANQGTVSLSSEVDTIYERTHAENLAGRVQVVIAIDDRL